MTRDPTISIVVPVSGAAPRLGETLRSLAEQEYGRLEVIIQASEIDPGSFASAQAIAKRFPQIFRLSAERDRGFGDALERGFSRARGDIQGYLGAWDILLPGALARIAAEIDPERQRDVVMGGALFTVDEIDIGVQHPAEYLGRFDHLAIWKRDFNRVPQPSLFWHRSVRERIGPFAQGEPFAVAYDFTCRVASRYEIHHVDSLWSATHLGAGRAASRHTEHDILETWIEISRRHWGSFLAPLWWRCAASLWIHRRDPHEHARHHARRSEQARLEGRRLAAALEKIMTWIYSPEMARGRFASYRRVLDKKS